MPYSEPTIVINGRTLSTPESMAVRVAVSSFRLELQDPEHRKALGEAMASSYDRLLSTVEFTMVGA